MLTKPFFHKTRRGLIRTISFTVAVMVALGGFAVFATVTAIRYRTRLEYTYERGLTELSEHLTKIETTLTKGTYAGTAAGTAKLAMQLKSQTDSAKVCLSQLPTYGTDLEQTYKFLSQVGEYAIALSTQMQNGTPVNTEQHQQMVQLSKNAKSISTSVSDLCDRMNQQGKWKEHIETTMEQTDWVGEFSSGLKNTEDSLSDFPTLLYDGPFSEHILQAKPRLIEHLPAVSQQQAAQTAAQALDVEIAALGEGELQEGNTIPSYLFYGDTYAVAITRMGGMVNYYYNNRPIGETALQYDACIQKAKDYLKTLGLGEFKESYYSVFDGVCLINFAYLEDDVICYTDLIKVGVALDNGEIVSYNAQGFIMNHTPRTIKPPVHTWQQAQKVLSSYLTIKSVNRAIIPLDSREEKLCYEFLCKGSQQEEILVYVNADTLQEEQLLIVLKTDGGTLTL